MHMYNQMVVAYINKIGGTHSQCLMEQVCKLWRWYLLKGLTISAEYLSGHEIWIADTVAEWKLYYDVFMLIQKVLGPCQIDLFASWCNHQLQDYVSWKPDPFEVVTDVFQLNWRDWLEYAFPLFALIDRFIQEEQSTIV